MYEKKTASKMISFLLAACITVSALPLSAFAAEEQSSTAFTPKRFFIVSGEKPDGTELAQKVSLASAEFQAKGICDSAEILYGEASFAREGDILIQISDTLGTDSFEITPADGKILLSARFSHQRHVWTEKYPENLPFRRRGDCRIRNA